jgi:UDP-glucose 4-epimerase
MPKVVLVTGAGGNVGGNLVARLAADPAYDRVIGVDTATPPKRILSALGRAEFVRADIRNPLIAKVISSAKVDTVVHAATTAHPAGPSRRTVIKEMNVIGTMQLLAACQKSPTVRKLVVKSSAAVYGSSSRSQAVFTEDDPPRGLSAGGYAKDAVEVEGYVRGFARRRPDVLVTTARLANLIGPNVDTVMSRYFALPVVPTVLGYDARIQLLHIEDALALMERLVTHDLPGTVNAAGDGVLTLWQAIHRAGRIPLPLPGFTVPAAASIFGAAKLVDFSPDQMKFLNFGRVLDTTRLKAGFGFTPRWTTRQAFDDYLAGNGIRSLVPVRRIADLERKLARASGSRSS